MNLLTFATEPPKQGAISTTVTGQMISPSPHKRSSSWAEGLANTGSPSAISNRTQLCEGEPVWKSALFRSKQFLPCYSCRALSHDEIVMSTRWHWRTAGILPVVPYIIRITIDLQTHCRRNKLRGVVFRFFRNKKFTPYSSICWVPMNKFHRCPRLMISAKIATSAGFTPGMRDACPRFSGRQRLNFSRLSYRRAGIFQ